MGIGETSGGVLGYLFWAFEAILNKTPPTKVKIEYFFIKVKWLNFYERQNYKSMPSVQNCLRYFIEKGMMSNHTFFL
jgi:hypothetical protein